VSNSSNASGALTVLTAHAPQIFTLATELSKLPKSIKSKATTTVDQAQTALKREQCDASRAGRPQQSGE
jgi:hypothetical protein